MKAAIGSSAIGIAVALAAFSGAALAQGRAGPQDVRVVNSATEPVPVKPPTVTHMNARVLDHVRFSTGSGTSTTASCGNDTGIFQIALDGATSSPFIVPPGRALVITDVSFGARARQDYPWTVGTLVSVDFRVSGANRRLWQSTTVVDAAMAAGQALWGKEQILSGVVVGPGQTVCLRAGLGFEAQNGQASFINLSKLYGYLVDL